MTTNDETPEVATNEPPAVSEEPTPAPPALPSLGTLLVEGTRALRRYKGLMTVLYLLQVAIALIFSWAAMHMLSVAFADKPVFDRAVAGDVAALVFVLSDFRYVFTSILWLAVVTVMCYSLLSWYLVGGLNAVLIERPSGRANVAREFGVGGARALFPYARLFLLSLLPYTIIGIAMAMAIGSATSKIAYGLTFFDVMWALLPRVGLVLLLLAFHMTAVDYARIELNRTLGLASRHALLRAYRSVGSDWRPLVHVLVYVGFFLVVSFVYVFVTEGHPMRGAGLAVMLFVMRQILAMVRFAGEMTCAAGQVVYASARSKDDAPRKRLPVVQ